MHVTFKLDCELNDQGHWISENTTVQVNTNIEANHFRRQLNNGNIPVIIESGIDEYNNQVSYEPYTEWFNISAFHNNDIEDVLEQLEF